MRIWRGAAGGEARSWSSKYSQNAHPLDADIENTLTTVKGERGKEDKSGAWDSQTHTTVHETKVTAKVLLYMGNCIQHLATSTTAQNLKNNVCNQVTLLHTRN